MKVVQIRSWKEKVGKEEHDVNICNVISVIMNIAMQQENLKGFDNIRKINRIANALDKIDNGRLVLLEEDYDLIKGFIEKYAPAGWGMNKDIMDALDDFMNAKKE